MLWISLALAQEPTELVVGEATYRLGEGTVIVEKAGQQVVYQAPGAVALVLVNGQVWVTMQQQTASPVGELLRMGGEGGGASPVASVAPQKATVVEVVGGVVVINQGSKQGLSAGDEVRFLGVREGASQQQVAVGRVSRIEAERAWVELARGGRVISGDTAEKSSDVWHYPVAPERMGETGDLSVTLRPILGVNTLGGGILAEVSTQWSFAGPWYVAGKIDPLALGFSNKGASFVGGAVGTGGYESRYFSVGLGGGVWTEEQVAGDTPRLAIVQEARLGGRDGLSVRVHNTFLLSERYQYEYQYSYGYYEEPKLVSRGYAFMFGGTAVDLQVPTGHRTDLFGSVHVDQGDSMWVEGGVASWLYGNGDAGSLGLKVAAGYGAIGGYAGGTSTEIYGPLVSFGLKYRFQGLPD